MLLVRVVRTYRHNPIRRSYRHSHSVKDIKTWSSLLVSIEKRVILTTPSHRHHSGTSTRFSHMNIQSLREFVGTVVDVTGGTVTDVQFCSSFPLGQSDFPEKTISFAIRNFTSKKHVHSEYKIYNFTIANPGRINTAMPTRATAAIKLPRFAFHRIAIFFVSAILAIRLVVAPPSPWNAGLVALASNLVRFASALCRARRAISLVRAIPAVVFVVADPSMTDASSILAFELRVRATGVGTVRFILSVATVKVEITEEVMRYALIDVALEFAGSAYGAVAVLLVGIVTAIVVVIANLE